MAEPQDKDVNDAGGVFGNLPSSRPGTRSPRRDKAAGDTAAKAAPAKAAARTGAAKPKAAPKGPRRANEAAPPPPPKPPADPPPEPPPPAIDPPGATGPERIGGIEDLAWAGVAVAAQAATVGVKAASRAMDAVRKSIDRQ